MHALLTAAGETTSWIPGAVCAGLLAVVAVLMLAIAAKVGLTLL